MRTLCNRIRQIATYGVISCFDCLLQIAFVDRANQSESSPAVPAEQSLLPVNLRAHSLSSDDMMGKSKAALITTVLIVAFLKLELKAFTFF